MSPEIQCCRLALHLFTWTDEYCNTATNSSPQPTHLRPSRPIHSPRRPRTTSATCLHPNRPTYDPNGPRTTQQPQFIAYALHQTELHTSPKPPPNDPPATQTAHLQPQRPIHGPSRPSTTSTTHLHPKWPTYDQNGPRTIKTAHARPNGLGSSHTRSTERNSIHPSQAAPNDLNDLPAPQTAHERPPRTPSDFRQPKPHPSPNSLL
ncbi:hypothetical protein PAXINDRAFT_21346 [Paxillus involutus ATCC 200175]|uniref:Uncharacterized protein n=1 Tax=Paxillus involutus ATCC 200175 TaxID=664439 RepID=A0A0C9TAZ3_PAXIN|nr:hypothetical protein PAXINDRAFT_21346 [Paxillus involutus ATCC 200175]